MALFLGIPRWAGTRKVKPIWILMKQETVSSSGMAICKSAPRSRQITTPAPHHSVFTGRMPFLPPNQQRQSTEGTQSVQKQKQQQTSNAIGSMTKKQKRISTTKIGDHHKCVIKTYKDTYTCLASYKLQSGQRPLEGCNNYATAQPMFCSAINLTINDFKSHRSAGFFWRLNHISTHQLTSENTVKSTTKE